MVFNIVKWGRTARLAMIFVFTLTALIFPQSSFAHTEAEAAEAQAQKEDIALQDFGGLNFGLGVGVVVTPSTRLVGNAQVVNGIVRAEDQSQATGLFSWSHITSLTKRNTPHGHKARLLESSPEVKTARS